MEKQNAYISVYNVPDYANDYPYWLVTYTNDECWFYGAYPTQQKAQEAQKELQSYNTNTPRIIVENPHYTK